MRCALYWYVPVSVVWAKARDIDTRSRPPEAWLERVIKWLTGQGSDPGSLYETVTYEGDGSFGDCYGYGPGVRITYYVDGFWRHGYVNGQYAGSVFIGTTLYQYETMGGSVCA